MAARIFLCRKCGLEVRWRRLPSGKLCPESLDHSDHWDVCSETAWRNAPASVRAARLRKHPPFKTRGIRPKLYRGRRPPWEFPAWQWVDPADQEKHDRWLAANGYAEAPEGQGGVSGPRARVVVAHSVSREWKGYWQRVIKTESPMG